MRNSNDYRKEKPDNYLEFEILILFIAVAVSLTARWWYPLFEKITSALR